MYSFPNVHFCFHEDLDCYVTRLSLSSEMSTVIVYLRPIEIAHGEQRTCSPPGTNYDIHKMRAQ